MLVLTFALIQLVCSATVLCILSIQRHRINQSTSIVDFLSDIHTIMEGQDKLLLDILNAIERQSKEA